MKLNKPLLGALASKFISKKSVAITNFFAICLPILLILLLESCSYSFTGASVPAHIKSVAIPSIADRSGSGEFNLSDRLTKTLIQKFIEDNTLFISDRANASSVIEGSITQLLDAPAVVGGVSGTDKITSKRITITVQIIYKDLVKKVNVFDRSFSNYADYQITDDVVSKRRDAIEKAIQYISEDILLGVVSNW